MLQQTPSAANPDAHSLAPAAVVPFTFFATQLPPPQYDPLNVGAHVAVVQHAARVAQQSVSPVHDVAQAPATHEAA